MRKCTPKSLYNKAVFYLSRYASSSENLRAILEKKVFKAQQEGQDVSFEEASVWIEDILKRMTELGYLDDERYSASKVRTLLESGKSVRTIKMKLKQKGLSEEQIEEALHSHEEESGALNDETDLKNALRLVRKKRIGFMRPEEERASFYQKDMAALGRAGFSFETAQKALAGEDDS